MKVKEIHFNHDAVSATADAIDLTEDGSSVITAPEWLDGAKSKPAAYARAALTQPVTIKAKFTGGPPGATLAIRATKTVGTPRFPFVRVTPSVLGDVKERDVLFDQNGNSQLEAFEVSGRPDLAATGIYEEQWTWQALKRGRWIRGTATEHRIYLIPDLPKAPWSQTAAAVATWQIPWALALDKACEWAAGAGTADDAAALIARTINQHPKHVYDGESQFARNGVFHLSQYLWALDNEVSVNVDCRTAATLLATFANLLGADLAPLRLRSKGSGNLGTKDILLINLPPWMARAFNYHEVALVLGNPLLDLTGGVVIGGMIPETPWISGFGQEQLIYDACLELNEPMPLLPVKMRFGRAGTNTGDYRDRLIASGDGDRVTLKQTRPLI